MMSLGAAKLLGILFESLGNGVFLVMFVYNMYLQLRNLSDRNATRPNVLLLVSSTLLFVMITARWAIGVARIYEAVVDLGGRVPISKYFADITAKKQIGVTALFEFQVLVADLILVYRLYHVWKPHWWLCIIPSLAYIGVCISASFLIWAMTHADLSRGVFQRDVQRWITLSFSFTISNNIYCTVAIILRLWRSHHAVAHASSNSYVWRVLRVFIESASLLTIFMTVTFATFLGGYNIQYCLLDTTSPIIGISFVLILLRLNFNKHGSSTTSNNTISQRGASSNYPLRSISVNVAQHVDIDSDLESKTAGKGSYGDMA
ncbi:hypothetical protein BDM02DRAFT_3220464 [Thelephora ganbajun]|uniref:Uncharacterized protein n=1 Tax=Thelephora ganbajun TaxID=370292 RepID=A0ACB6ZMH1_THEGA|nr:hypothetical protein BDM02DRAFT_3220464 [Thelephora ganbajun]